jgi:hypothetical protein
MGVPTVPVYWEGQPARLQVPYPAVGRSVGPEIAMVTLSERVVFVTVAVPPEVGVKVIVPNPETEAGVALTPVTVQL